jgi:hypothetical protein
MRNALSYFEGMRLPAIKALEAKIRLKTSGRKYF